MHVQYILYEWPCLAGEWWYFSPDWMSLATGLMVVEKKAVWKSRPVCDNALWSEAAQVVAWVPPSKQSVQDGASPLGWLRLCFCSAVHSVHGVQGRADDPLCSLDDSLEITQENGAFYKETNMLF